MTDAYVKKMTGCQVIMRLKHPELLGSFCRASLGLPLSLRVSAVKSQRYNRLQPPSNVRCLS